MSKTNWFQLALAITSQGSSTPTPYRGSDLAPGEELTAEEEAELMAHESVVSAGYEDEYPDDNSDWENLTQEDTFVPLNTKRASRAEGP